MSQHLQEGSSLPRHDLIEMTASLVSAYLSNNHVTPTDLPVLLTQVHDALTGLAAPRPASEAGPEKPTPAQVRRSVTHDALISFEDGKPYKALRRHLTTLGLTPEEYRAKWGLPVDYPMVSPGYSAQRSELARLLGLGQQRRKFAAKPPAESATAPAPEAAPVEEAPEAMPEVAPEPRKARRARKVAESV